MSALAFPHAPASATEARHRLVLELAAAGVPPDSIDDAELVLSELVGNAIRHGRPLPGGGLRVEWRVDPFSVRISVVDGGDAAASLTARRVDEDAVSGRGLTIIDAVADEWGAAVHPLGTLVWAEVDF